MSDALTTILVPGAPFLAIDIQPDLAVGTFTVDVSEVGGFDLLGWSSDMDGDWVNVVCDVTSVEVDRGALQTQGQLTQTEAGTVTLSLIDTGRRFDPLSNQDAVHKGTPLRVRAWGYEDDGAGPRWDAVLFTGAVDAPSVEYRRVGAPLVTLTATDAYGTIAAWESLGRDDPGVGAGDDLLERVTRVLAEIGGTIPISSDSDALYTATLAPTVLDKPADIINAAAKAEQGRVWVDTSNQVVVRSRFSELAGTVRGTLSDIHGEAPLGVHCCLAGGTPNLRPETIVNRVIASRRVPTDPLVTSPPPAVPAQVDDAYSQARYGMSALNATGLDLETDAQAQAWAVDVLLDSAQPAIRVDELTPAPWGSPTTPADPGAWQAVCMTDVGDRWLYRMHPELGDPVARALGVLGIRHSITPDGWTITWQTVDAPEPGNDNPSGWFIIDLSEVGGEDVLPSFGGVA